MIPLQLSLKNFLSYREAQLDFRGLHVACICGANGAGKSSLLEAMVWAIWGESRALTEDDVIHAGATEALVDFLFQVQQQTYRILRSRHRGQVSTLEFQVQIPSGFRSLTERGIRATQQLILQHLKLDYDTFINSAYLRQGRADEFMLKRPSERKQILADLLKLDQYDALSEQAKEQSRQFKAEQTLLERSLENIAQQLQQAPALEAEQTQLGTTLATMQRQQDADLQTLRQLQQLQQQRQTWSEQQALQQQQAQTLAQDCQRLTQELQAAQQQRQQLEAVLQEAEAITQQQAQLQALQAEEEAQSGKFQMHQRLQAQLQQLQQQLLQQQQSLKEQLRQAETELGWLNQQQQEIQQTLGRASEIAAGLESLRQARSRLSQLDQLQMQVAPLMQRRQQVQSQLDRSQTRLTARLEELSALRHQLAAQQQQQPAIQQAAESISAQISQIERRQLYQQQVREKGIERRTFMERLQEQQRKCEREMAELDQKLLLLQQDRAGSEPDQGIPAEAMALQVGGATPIQGGQLSFSSLRCAEATGLPTGQTALPTAYPPCPLCNHPLDAYHWQVVIDRHQQDKQEIQDQLWVIREQLTTSDREIRVLRQEYRDLDKELSQYGVVLEQRGKLQEQLEGLLQGQARLQQVIAEQSQLQLSLQQGDYAPELQQELHLLEQTLSQLSYDDRNHALVRGQVDRWRWAEVKSAELRQAQRKQAQLEQQQPQLLATIEQLNQQLSDLQHSTLQQQIDQQERSLLELGYLPEQHLALRQRLKQTQTWQSRYQALQQAREYYPALQERIQTLGELWSSRNQMQQALLLQMQQLAQQLAQLSDPAAAIQELEQQMQARRAQMDQRLAQLGRLQQQAQQLVELAAQQQQFSTELAGIKHQVRIYQELAQAFGKNGIQALMIENVLPQLEAETNQTLGRLSANQLHVQFVTQRASRKTSATKLIDTLDILISDMQGTRPYETYSGGETFRVNFAIRLALARLLAQRSGMALQMLIIDEGFGTQDEAGCDRLIGAINAIAADFACILTVTHIPHLKEAFQTRIEVNKTEQGSQIRLSA
ncbi:MAG: SMC family ATPase [Pegethrix bostrychoides GSE-TBD4-15B]|uniref:Nuclease SbcCD subunit C n=1 Tax=Pegethrix bostrychoides GSE-TBD4-15B TaxID=2839662 RepID=A0A951U6R5_9CYAN|nr:SMC family ATPase [Pegethrix bostrychoides GSE-TBD4-15B]